MIVKKTCSQCSSQAILSKEYDIGNIHFSTYTCGHVVGKKHPSISDFKNFKSLDGYSPYKFQIEGAITALKSSGRFGIFDEMGLGKTVQALMVASALNEKFLVIAKAGLRIQWSREIYRWLDEGLAQIIESENEFIMKGARGYIVSYDMLWRFKDIEAFVRKLGVSYIILDEVQHIKNSESKRTNAVRTVSKTVPYLAALSGTPIMNNTGEFFPILNMLYPEKFPSLHRFEVQFVNSYWDGYKQKYGGIKNYKAFKEYTSDFIIRRTRQEVLPDLPRINRSYLFCELGGIVEEAYKATLKEFQEYYLYGGIGDSGLARSNNILAFLTKMRHLVGIAKVEPIVDYVKEFLTDTDRKICIFIHHKDVGFTLASRLRCSGIDVTELTADMDSMIARPAAVERFRNSSRVLIASTLASGEGLNLQFCQDCIIGERQWNPAKEEQAEARFPRIGSTADKINVLYPTAVGTVEEFFAEIVEKKRAICSNTLDGTELKWDESSIMKELTEILATSGGKKWNW